MRALAEKQDKARETWAEMCSIPSLHDRSDGFGAYDELDDESANLPAGTRFMVHPHAQKKVKWDLLVAALIIYSTLSVPFRIGFDQAVGLLGTITDYFVDIVFLFDIIFSFRTAFIDEVS